MNYKGQFESKMPNTKTSIFAIMSGLANEVGAINLSQGFPNFPIDMVLVELVHKYMQQGYNQYAPMPGEAVLREAIAHKVKKIYDIDYNPNTEITVTAGATQGLYCIFSAMLQQGDEVIFFEPAYDSYLPAIVMNGAVPKPLKLQHPAYTINWEEVRATITKRTRMIVINSPHNPSGAVLSADDLKQLADITRDTNIIVLSDEVYEHLIFDNIRHESVCYYPELAQRSFVTASFGKTFHVTGWKTGYVLAPENLMAEYRKVHQFNVFTVNTPMQRAIAEYLQEPEHYQGLPALYQAKRDYFDSLIKDSLFKPLPCKGTYFQLLDYSTITNEKEMDFAVRLTKEYGLATIPVSPFYKDETENKVLRVCFAKTDETLEQAAEILNRVK